MDGSEGKLKEGSKEAAFRYLCLDSVYKIKLYIRPKFK